MYPTDLKYTKDHEWLRVKDGEAEVGITDFAQKQLGDVVFVELPTVGHQLGRHEAFGTIESVKAVSELYMPVSGNVTAVNDELSHSPENVNTSPYEAWIIKLKLTDTKEISELLSAEQYEQFLKEED